MPSCGDRQRWKLPSALRALRAGRARDDECWCPHVRLWLPWSNCSWRRLESQNAPPRSPASTACLWQQSRWFKKKLQANNSDSLTWLLRPGEAFWIPSQTSCCPSSGFAHPKLYRSAPAAEGNLDAHRRSEVCCFGTRPWQNMLLTEGRLVPELRGVCSSWLGSWVLAVLWSKAD